MSRIFKISGNFMQYGRWLEPDPSFSGKIVVNELNEFYGFCDELYNADMSELNRTRYIAGSFAENGRNGRQGIAFYKMSNDPEQAPLMYVVPDLAKPDRGSWAALSIFGYFEAQGRAKIVIEDVPFSDEEKQDIKAKYEALDKTNNSNGKLLERIECCRNIVIYAK